MPFPGQRLGPAGPGTRFVRRAPASATAGAAAAAAGAPPVAEARGIGARFPSWEAPAAARGRPRGAVGQRSVHRAGEVLSRHSHGPETGISEPLA